MEGERQARQAAASSSAQEADHGINQIPDLMKLATLIAGAAQPVSPRLLLGLDRSAAGIHWAARAAEAHPSRETLRARLKVMLKAAQLLRTELMDKTVQHLLVMAAPGTDDVEADGQAYRGLGSLIPRVEEALHKVPSGRGSYKHDPGTNSPQAVCALSVVFAWRMTRGCWPLHTALAPREACRSLWRLADMPLRGWNDNLAGWKPHLRRAKSDMQAGCRPEIERAFMAPESEP